MMRHLPLLLACLLLAGCPRPGAPEAPEPETVEPVKRSRNLTVYSGRNEKLIGPLFSEFTRKTGIKVEARYGETAELAATIMEEGARTPAGVFIAQDAAALGALSQAGRLRRLSSELRERVPERFISPNEDWIGISGRARAIAYNTETVQTRALPQRLEDLTNPRYRGRFGIAPSNASFQSHMAVYGVVHGEDALRQLLTGIARNQPRRYAKNDAIVEAVINREIDFGLTNHYYVYQALQRREDGKVDVFFMPQGDGSAFVNLAGGAVLTDDAAAEDLLEFLLTKDSQRYFATETFEYPLVDDVSQISGLAPLSELRTPAVDYAQVSAVLPRTLELIRESGLLQ
jgi:iron(III) transport system substrate-binding protein